MKNNHFIFSGHDTIELANKFGTPLYVMSEDIIRKNANVIVDSFKKQGIDFEVVYAGKALLNTAICCIIKDLGLDVYKRQGVWKIIKGYTKEANINKDITPHMIRHSFALHLIQNGADLHMVKELLGHLDISSTQVYIKGIEQNIKETYKAFHPRA